MVKAPWEMLGMVEAGRRLGEVIARLEEVVDVGVTPLELDRIAEEMIDGLGGRPAFKGYRVGREVFPATLCISVNDEVVHGIPGNASFASGDLVSIDAGLSFDGYFADAAFSVQVGEQTPEVTRLLDDTRESLYRGIAQARAGLRIGDIGHAIESHLQPQGYGIVRDFVGHGIGRRLHERPSVPSYGKPGRGHLLRNGMCIAIEPMVTLGSSRVLILEDGWTVVTRDGSLAAHFEHTVAITPEGPRILTALPGTTSDGRVTADPSGQ